MSQRTDTRLIWQVEQLARESREQGIGGLWAVMTAPPGERIEIGFVYDETDQQRLATANDHTIRDLFTSALTNARRDRTALTIAALRAVVAIYKVPGEVDWQTVLIDRGAVTGGWATNGIHTAVAEIGMDVLGFLSLALPELLADLVHGAGREAPE